MDTISKERRDAIRAELMDPNTVVSSLKMRKTILALLDDLDAAEKAEPVAWDTYDAVGWVQPDGNGGGTMQIKTPLPNVLTPLYTHLTIPPGFRLVPVEPTEAVDYFGSLVGKARVAAEKAMRKYPQPNYIALKIAEEAGEVVRGCVHYAENRMEWSEVEGEIVQLLAMLIRLVTEGDEINGVLPPLMLAAAPEAK